MQPISKVWVIHRIVNHGPDVGRPVNLCMHPPYAFGGWAMSLPTADTDHLWQRVFRLLRGGDHLTRKIGAEMRGHRRLAEDRRTPGLQAPERPGGPS